MRQELVLFFYGKIRSNKPLGSFQIVIEVAKCLNMPQYEMLYGQSHRKEKATVFLPHHWQHASILNTFRCKRQSYRNGPGTRLVFVNENWTDIGSYSYCY